MHLNGTFLRTNGPIVDIPSDTYDLGETELQMFTKLAGYQIPKELEKSFIETTDEKYDELLNNFKAEQIVLKD